MDVLVDVRRYPGSRRVPWTNSGEIERALPVDYLHLAELGGRRSPQPESVNGGWRSQQFQGYADHMASTGFVAAFERLLGLARERRPAVMCAEAQWWRCHRRLLSDALLTHGVEVRHIDARGGAEPHRLTDFAVVDHGRMAYPPQQSALDV